MTQKTSFNHLPTEVIFPILQHLDLSDYLTVRAVSVLWKTIAEGKEFSHWDYVQNKLNIPDFGSFGYKASDWTSVPLMNGAPISINGDSALTCTISSVYRDIITFYFRYDPFQKAQFFSFTKPVPVSDQYVYLGQWNDVYFLKPPTQLTPNKPELTLITLDINNPTAVRTCHLPFDLPSGEPVWHYEINYCFPLAEDKIVIVLKMGKIWFWDLAPETPVCYKTVQVQVSGSHITAKKSGNHLIVNGELVQLDPTTETTVPSDGMYKLKQRVQDTVMEFFQWNQQGVVEKKWEVNLSSLLNIRVVHAWHLAMNDNYIVVEAVSPDKRHNRLCILDTTGRAAYHPFDDAAVMKFPYNISGKKEPFPQLMGNVLAIPHVRKKILYFWHIPSKRCISKLDLKQHLEDVPHLGAAKVEDFCFDNGKLTLVLSFFSDFTHHASLKRQYRIVQFASDYPKPVQSIPAQSTYDQWTAFARDIYAGIFGDKRL
jgi:hypothetical protein